MKNKNKKKAYFFVATFFVLQITSCNFQLLPKVNADTITNPNYSIDVGTIDTNPQPTIKPQILGSKTQITPSPIPEFTTGPNYTANESSDSLSVDLSQDTIDYGILSSTNPVIRTSTITFFTPLLGAEILTYENHPLISTLNDVIPNTTCDNGVCNPFIAALWNNTLTYGFGYRCDTGNSEICDPQFSNETYFKQYADDSQNILPVVFAETSKRNSKIKATATYKVNISGTQKTGGYYNSITYLTIPNF